MSSSTKGDEFRLIDEALQEHWLHEPVDLLELIGEGTYGKVYKTPKRVDGRETVVKVQVIRKVDGMAVSEVMRSMVQECEFMFECGDCPYVVSLFHTYRIGNRMHMLMEHAGTSLKALMESLPPPKFEPLQITQYAKQICQGLSFIQSKGIYHEELIPQNIIIRDGIAKITDFGIASRRSQDRVGSHLPSRFGDMKEDGMPGWQAPEIHEVVSKPYHEDETQYGEDGINIGHRGEPSNMYSVGFLVWYMFVGTEPLFGDAEVQSFIIRGYRPNIPELVPYYLRRLTKVCWKQNYKLRPALSTVIQYLEEVERNIGNLSKETIKRILPVRYAPLLDMYKGEFIEYLLDNGQYNLCSKMANEYWIKVSEIADRLNETCLMRQYHISLGDIPWLVELSNEQTMLGRQGAGVQYVHNLNKFELVRFFERNENPRVRSFVETIKSLTITAEVLTALNDPAVYAEHSVPSSEIGLASRLIAEAITKGDDVWTLDESHDLE